MTVVYEKFVYINYWMARHRQDVSLSGAARSLSFEARAGSMATFHRPCSGDETSCERNFFVPIEWTRIISQGDS